MLWWKNHLLLWWSRRVQWQRHKLGFDISVLVPFINKLWLTWITLKSTSRYNKCSKAAVPCHRWVLMGCLSGRRMCWPSLFAVKVLIGWCNNCSWDLSLLALFSTEALHLQWHLLNWRLGWYPPAVGWSLQSFLPCSLISCSTQPLCHCHIRKVLLLAARSALRPGPCPGCDQEALFENNTTGTTTGKTFSALLACGH